MCVEHHTRQDCAGFLSRKVLQKCNTFSVDRFARFVYNRYIARSKAMNDFDNPFYRLGAAMGKLHWYYTRCECLRGYAFTAPTNTERKEYLRKALKSKAQGIVEHDRLLNGVGLQ
jgi:hypothetical protein